MAVTAKFIADFSSFYDAVRKAELDINRLGFSVDKAGDKLHTMVDRFSGKRIVQEATLMAEAVERIGGVSKLTENELRQMGAKAQEAADKLRAMGKDVPVGIQNIADKAAHLNKTSTDLIGTLKTLAAGFGAAFSIQAIAGFVVKVVNAAGEINDMSAKLGISTSAVQGFGFAAEQTGASMETVGRAISEMNKSLASGDNSTRDALAAVGLQFEHIRQLSPEEAFQEIAAAIQQIPDPMEQTRVATELFGKAGKELLPAIKEGFVELAAEAPKMSAATIKALDSIGDAWSKLKAQVIVATADIIASIRSLPKVSEEAQREFQKIEEAGRRSREALTTTIPNAPSRSTFSLLIPDARLAESLFNRVNGTLEQQAKRLNDAGEASKKATKLSEQLQAAFDKLGDTVDRGGSSLASLGRSIKGEFDNAIQRAIENTQFLDAHFRRLWDSVDHGGASLARLGQSFGKIDVELKGNLGSFLKNGLGSLFENKRGEAAKSFGDGLKNMLGGIGTGIFNTLGSMLTGGLSGLIGSGISLIGKGLGKLFGFGDTEKKKVDEMRQAFIDQIGGWHELNKAAQKVGMTLDGVLNAKKVKDYEKAVAELQRRMDLQGKAWDKVNEAIERYGFSLEQLGPTLQKQRLTETALQLYEDFQLLTAAGIDTETVLKQMSVNINEFVKRAIVMGIEVDKSMRPMLQKMVEMGLLTDENGELITDLEDSGITFSESITEAFAEVADSLREMIDLLKQFLGLTDQIPSSVVPGEGNGSFPGDVPNVPLPPDLQNFTGLAGVSAGGGIVVNVSGSVLTERDLVQAIQEGLDSNRRSLYRDRAA